MSDVIVQQYGDTVIEVWGGGGGGGMTSSDLQLREVREVREVDINLPPRYKIEIEIPPLPPAPPVVKHGCQYLSRAFDYDNLIRNARERLTGVDFDTVVGTGLSGTIACSVLAHALRKHLLIVRKENDGSHSRARAEGSIGKRWIFVDDLIFSGNTRDRVIEQVGLATSEKNQTYSEPHAPVFVGVYTYGDWLDEPIWRPEL